MRRWPHPYLFMKTLTQLADAIQNHDSFLIISHISPDGDTLGSSAALGYILEALGKRCFQRCDDGVPRNLSSFPALSEFLSREDMPYSCAIAVDCADVQRMGTQADAFMKAKSRLVIDHHKTNEGFGDINYISDDPAAAQCVFALMEELQVPLNKNIAECLYIAFITDTGRFAYHGIGQQTMEIVAKLYSQAIDISHINRVVFRERSYSKTKLIAAALDKLETWFDGDVACIFLDYETYSPFASADCDTEGIVNYALEVKGCKVAVFGHEKQPGVTKISLRSISPDYDVSAIAQHFDGGGHIQASGCTIKKPCNAAKDTIFELLKGCVKN